MKQDDIANIQMQLNITLPVFYVELISDYPSALKNTDAEDFALMSNPEEILRENLSVRKAFYGQKWPDNFFVIGQDGCGDLYVIKLDAKSFSVGFFDHERLAFLPFADSKEMLITKLLREIRQN